MVPKSVFGTEDHIDFQPPWMPRLYRAERLGIPKPPRILPDLRPTEFGTIDKDAAVVLRVFADDLKKRWQKNWTEILAVGPFLKTRRPREAIQFILCGKIRSFSANLAALSKALAAPYSEFTVLPDLFILQDAFVATLMTNQNRNWELTESYSVRLSG